MNRFLTLLALIVMGACGDDVAAPVEDEPTRDFAVHPVTVSPDHIVMSIGDLLDLNHVNNQRDYTKHPEKVHVSVVTNEEPKLVRCGGMYDCEDLERLGWIIVDEARVLNLLHEWCPAKKEQTAGGSDLVLLVQSCFGLVRWEHFWDSAGVEWRPNRPAVPAAYRPLRCGRTWIAYRLKARADETSAVTYPHDELFSDIAWVDVTGCSS